MTHCHRVGQPAETKQSTCPHDSHPRQASGVGGNPRTSVMPSCDSLSYGKELPIEQ